MCCWDNFYDWLQKYGKKTWPKLNINTTKTRKKTYFYFYSFKIASSCFSLLKYSNFPFLSLTHNEQLTSANTKSTKGLSLTLTWHFFINLNFCWVKSKYTFVSDKFLRLWYKRVRCRQVVNLTIIACCFGDPSSSTLTFPIRWARSMKS